MGKGILSAFTTIVAVVAVAAGIGIPPVDYVMKPGEQQGRVVFVNAQKRANVDWIKESASYLGSFIRIRTTVEEGSFNLLQPQMVGEATIYIVDDESLPMSLVALEAKWGMINVSKLISDKEPFFKARTKKMLSRVFCILAGGANSQYPLGVTGSVTSTNDLDKMPDEQLSFDIAQKLPKGLAAIGIIQGRYTSYTRACREGWAPAPTNEVQRVIWEKVKAEQSEKPSNPLKITPGMKPKGK